MTAERQRAIFAANALSLSRVPLAGLIWIAPASPIWVLSIIAVAGLTDVLDGWMVRRAKRRGWEAGDMGALAADVARGEVIDGVADKIFVASTVLALFVVARPELWVVGALVSRELLLFPLVVLYRLLPEERRPTVNFTAGFTGKAATFFQLTALVLGFLGHAWLEPVAAIAGTLGALAAVIYVGRVFVGDAPDEAPDQ